MRSKRRSWQNTTEYKAAHRGRHGWTRRVTWYEGGPAESIRLKFEDCHGTTNRLYSDYESAQIDYDAFGSGDITTDTLRG